MPLNGIFKGEALKLIKCCDERELMMVKNKNDNEDKESFLGKLNGKKLFRNKKEKKLIEAVPEPDETKNTAVLEDTVIPETAEILNFPTENNNTETVQTETTNPLPTKPVFKIVNEHPEETSPESEPQQAEDTDEEEKTPSEENEFLHGEEHTEKEEREYKPYRVKSFVNTLFRFAQALNAKPDEFLSDEDITNTNGEKQNGKDSENFNTNENSTEFDRERYKIKAPPPIEDIDMSFATVKKVNGNIYIENNIAPMYTIETTKSSFNVEIGKLYPIIFRAYEEYLDPSILKARREEEKRRKQTEINDDEIITKPTTVFGIFKNDKDKKTVKTETVKKTYERKDYAKISPDNYDEEDEQEAEQYRYFFLTNRERKKLRQEEKKTAPKDKQTKKNKKTNTFVSGLAKDWSLLIAGSRQEKDNDISDYDVPQDARRVAKRIDKEVKNYFIRSTVLIILFLVAFGIAFVQKFFTQNIDTIVMNADVIYCWSNLFLLIAGAVVSFETLKRGFALFKDGKGRSETVLCFAFIGCAVQCIASISNSKIFYNGEQSLYTVLVLFAFTVNFIGRLVMSLRVRENFLFVLHKRRKYAGAIFNNKKIAEKMVRGLNKAEPLVAYQRKTKFFQNFMNLSHADDPVKKIAAKLSLWTVILAVIAAIIHGYLYESVLGAISSFTMITTLSIPAACILSVNIPMKKMCHRAVLNDAMIVGYPAVQQFGDTNAIMADSRELYPLSNVNMVKLRPFVPDNVLENSLLNVAAILRYSGTSLTSVFSKLIDRRQDDLPYVDSVKFEENKGLVGWVGGERVLIGTLALMKKYGIIGIEYLPKFNPKEDLKYAHNRVIYIANGKELTAMLEVAYSPDLEIRKDLKRLYDSGVYLLVRTVDPVISKEMIVQDYGLHKDTVKILPNNLGYICKQAVSEEPPKARCYICTRGKFGSFAKAIASCINIRERIFIAKVVQVIGIAIGFVLSTVMAIFSSGYIGTLEAFLFLLFWSASTVIAPCIAKSSD